MDVFIDSLTSPSLQTAFLYYVMHPGMDSGYRGHWYLMYGATFRQTKTKSDSCRAILRASEVDIVNITLDLSLVRTFTRLTKLMVVLEN
jgi:hypothetical protein